MDLIRLKRNSEGRHKYSISNRTCPTELILSRRQGGVSGGRNSSGTWELEAPSARANIPSMYLRYIRLNYISECHNKSPITFHQSVTLQHDISLLMERSRAHVSACRQSIDIISTVSRH